MADDEDLPQSNDTLPSGVANDAPDNVMIEPVPKDIEARTQIEAHIERFLDRFLDKPALVTQELAPVEGGIDLLILSPTMLYPFFSLVTVGMSDIAMPTPPGAETYRYAELLLALPRTWPMSSPAWKREENYWPIRCLRALARMPYLHDAWVAPGYTVSHGGEPPHPIRARHSPLWRFRHATHALRDKFSRGCHSSTESGAFPRRYPALSRGTGLPL